MKFKRLVSVLGVFLVLCMVLTGCVYGRADVTINSDCSGILSYKAGIDKALLEDMEFVVGDDPEEFTVDGITYIGEEVSDNFTSADDFNDKIEEALGDDNTEIKLSKSGEDLILTFELYVANSETLPEDIDISGLTDSLEDSVIEFNVDFPVGYTVYQTTGDDYGIAISENRVTIDCVKVSEHYSDFTGDILLTFIASSIDSSSEPEAESSFLEFTDVDSNSPYKEAIKWAAESGITKGITATEFGTYQTCTKEQILTFIYRQEGQPSFEGYLADSTEPYYNAVNWAISKNITDGTNLSEPCTRVQALKYLFTLYRDGVVSIDRASQFIDVSKCTYLEKEAISWGLENGITNGTSTSTFSPDATCTRAQIVTFLYRYFA